MITAIVLGIIAFVALVMVIGSGVEKSHHRMSEMKGECEEIEFYTYEVYR